MKENVKKSLLLLPFIGVSVNAWAVTDILKASSAFVGLKGGYQLSIDDTYGSSNPHSALIGIYGGVQFTETWSWDLGYQYHGESHASDTSVKADTTLFETALRYDFHLQDNINLYGRLGAAYWDLEKTMSGTESVTANGLSALTEIGASYQLTPNIHTTLGYQFINAIGDSKTGKYNSNSLLLSVSYHFKKRPPVTIAATPIPSLPPLKKTTLIVTGSAAQSENLNKVVSILKDYPQAKVEIIGHTDSIGTKVDNQKLSERRAAEVVKLLKTKGIKKAQISMRGEGETRPIATNMVKAGRAKNRRVEAIITPFKDQVVTEKK